MIAIIGCLSLLTMLVCGICAIFLTSMMLVWKIFTAAFIVLVVCGLLTNAEV